MFNLENRNAKRNQEYFKEEVNDVRLDDFDESVKGIEKYPKIYEREKGFCWQVRENLESNI